MDLEKIVNKAWENRLLLKEKDTIGKCMKKIIDLELDEGKIRVSEINNSALDIDRVD